MAEDHLPRVLTIGSFDPEARRGVQVGIKTAAAFGVYGTSVVNEIRFHSEAECKSFSVPSESVAAQVDAVSRVALPDAVIVSGLGDPASIEMIAAKIEEYAFRNVVVNPGIAAGTDPTPETDDRVEALKSALFPKSTIVVANIPESEFITGLKIRNAMGMKAAAKLMHQAGAANMVVTGARIDGEECTDFLFDGEEYMDLPSERVAIDGVPGAGDTYAVAAAAGLAMQRDVAEAVAIAKVYVGECLQRAVAIGEDRLTLNHLYGWWEAGGSRGYGG